MRLTAKTDYCLRILIHLQKHNKKLKIQEIADELQVSKNHLSVAANLLSELGYISSSSGPKGGIEFNKSCEESTVGEFMEKAEHFDLVECFNESKNTCTLSPRCKLKKMLSGANKAFIEHLKMYKIKDLA